MTAELVEMFKWNAWANQKYREALSTIPYEDLFIDTPYGRLIDRIVHIFASFKMWHQRMEGESPDSVISVDDFSNWEELAAVWQQYDELLIEYVSTISSDKVASRVTYTSLDGSIYTRTIRHILLHLTAHPNYHRGQISAIFKLKQLGKLPSTDMVVYYLDQGIDIRTLPDE